jgi:hypothetical protein
MFAKHTGVRKPTAVEHAQVSEVTLARVASRELIDALARCHYDFDEIRLWKFSWV